MLDRLPKFEQRGLSTAGNSRRQGRRTGLFTPPCGHLVAHDSGCRPPPPNRARLFQL